MKKQLFATFAAFMMAAVAVLAQDAETFSLTVGGSKRLDLPFAVENYRLTPQGKVTVEELNKKQLNVTGTALGDCSLFVMGGGLTREYRISVKSNINNILKMLPPEYADGRLVILFIAVSHLIQMAASVSGEIIQYSRYYRYHTLIMVMLIGLIFGFNVWLLPIYGITGAAVASMLSFLVYSVVRIAFVRLKFGFNPFCLKHLLVLLFGAVAYVLSWLIPDLGNLILDLAVRSAVICILFVVPTLYFDLSEDMTAMYKRVVGKVFRRK